MVMFEKLWISEKDYNRDEGKKFKQKIGKIVAQTFLSVRAKTRMSVSP